MTFDIYLYRHLKYRNLWGIQLTQNESNQDVLREISNTIMQIDYALKAVHLVTEKKRKTNAGV